MAADQDQGALAITKSVKARQAKALAPYYPVVARYLRAHATADAASRSSADSFGESLAQWVDEGWPAAPAS